MAGFGGERVEPCLVDCLVGERADCEASAQDTADGLGLVRHASNGQERLFQVHTALASSRLSYGADYLGTFSCTLGMLIALVSGSAVVGGSRLA